MKNLTRAQRKREMKRFKPGDIVTWGHGDISHRVISVTERGVLVDVTSCAADDSSINYWALRQDDGSYALLVLFDHNVQGPGLRCRFRHRGVCSGPPRISTDEPDKRKPTWASLKG